MLEENPLFGTGDDKKYEKIEIIGSGTYGEVYKAKINKTNEPIAIKKIKIELENEGIPSTALREISLLRELKHKNIIKFLFKSVLVTRF